MSTLLSWSHYVELLSIKDINKLLYYLSIAVNQNIDVRNLRDRIKNNGVKERAYRPNSNVYELHR